jgi:PAS domain S-box-containing protein
MDISEQKAAQSALEKSERLYRLLTENANDVIWSCDLNMTFQYVSPSVEKLLGWTPDEVIEGGVTMTLPPESLRLAAHNLRVVLDLNLSGRRVSDPVIFEIEQNRKDGTRVWMEVSARPFLDDEGRMAGISGVTRDISERKKAEKALLRAKQEWERTFDSVPDLIAIIDNRHRILRANRAMAERLGLTPGQCIGRTCYESIHGTNQPIVSCPHALSLADGQEHTAEVREERLGGDFLVSCTPLFDEKGVRVGSVHVARDITGKNRSEEALRESEEKFRGIFENTLIGIFQATLEGRFITANPALARIFGHESPEDMISSVTDIGRQIYAESTEREKVITGLKSSGHLEKFLIKARRKDGSDIWVALNARLVRDKAGAIQFIEGMLEDITTQKRGEEALAESDRFTKEIITHANEGVVVYDRELRYLVWNRFMENLTGLSSQDVLGHRAADLFPHLREQGIEQIIHQALHGETVSSADVPFHAPQTGKSGWVQSTFTPHVNTRGEIVGVIGIIRNVTERKMTEDSLRQSERRLELALKGSGLAFWDLNAQTGEAIVDERWAEILGYPISKLNSNLDAWRKSLHPDDLSRVTAELMEHLAGKRSDYCTEYRIRTRSGNWKWIYDSGKNYEWDDEGKPLRAAGTHLDITERKQAEEKIQESEECFRQLFDNMADCIAVYQAVDDGNDFLLVDINRQGQQLSKVSRGEAVGKRVTDVFPAVEKMGLLDVFRHVWRTGESRHHPSSLYEDERLQQWVENYVFKLPSGLIIALYSDTTEIHKAADALQESEVRYRMLFDSAGDAIIIHNAEARILAVNQLAVARFGYTQAELISMTINLVDSPSEGQHAPECIAQLMEEGCLTFETVHQRKDGSLIPTEVSARKIIWQGQPAMLSICRDITDRKRAEGERRELEGRLNRAEKMEALGMLAGGVAHDLNNAMGILVGYSELLLDDIDKSSPLRTHVEYIKQGGERAAAIVQDLLTMARRGVQTSEIVDLNSVIDEFQDSPEFEKICSFHPNVRVETVYSAGLLNIKGSPVHLRKTVMNLVSNAAEAMPARGLITISTSNEHLDRPIAGYDNVQEGDYVVLSVEDKGEGISASEVKRIFEPFYTKKILGRSGTGLGLAVVWGTVKDHNGYINVQSEEGKGTRFSLYFPVTREEATKERQTIPIADYMGKGESILVVDDVQGQRELAARMLTKLNYNVAVAASGEEAVEYLKTHNVDLVVLDMIMDPGMDGLDTYRAILEIHPKQKAIIVSGFSESDRVRNAQVLGAGAYVRKPYMQEVLGLAVNKEFNKKVLQ